MFSNKDLRKLIIPLVIEQLLAVTIGMADTVMVSSCGEAAVSGISLVDSINFLLITLFSSLATGGAVIASQYIGRGDHKSASLAAKQLFYASLALSAVLGVIAVFFRKPVLNMVFGSIEADVMAHAQIYFLLSAISYPFLAVYNAGAALFRSMGDSRTTMLISILMNTINIVGNAILIYGFQMAAAGAATASLVSRAVGAIIITVLLLNPRRIIFYDKLHKPEIHLSMLKSILQIGVPNGLENSIFQIGKILVASIVSGFGTISITANAVAGNLASLQVIPGMALGMAMITVVGQCIGAKDYEAVKKVHEEADAHHLRCRLGYDAFDAAVQQADPFVLLTLRGNDHNDDGGLHCARHLRRHCLAAGLCPAERPARCERCALHDDCFPAFHVDLPHRLQLHSGDLL